MLQQFDGPSGRTIGINKQPWQLLLLDGEGVIEEEMIDGDFVLGIEEDVEGEEEEEEIPDPYWENGVDESEGYLDDDDEREFSDTSSIFSLLSQELLEPQVQIEEVQESMVVS